MAPAYAVARIIAAAAWLTAVAAACSASDEIPHYEYHHLGQFGLKRPAYTSVEKYHGRDALVVSSFGVINGKVSIVPDVAERLDDVAAIKPTTLTDHLIWPNLAQRVPDEAFDIPDLFLVCGGFLVPGAKTGQLTLLDARTNLVGRHELTKDEPGFFYHSAVWFDVNGDGRLDILTAKVNYPYHGEPKGRLLWLENPGHFDQGAWKERALYEGPDVFFRIADLDGGALCWRAWRGAEPASVACALAQMDMSRSLRPNFLLKSSFSCGTTTTMRTRRPGSPVSSTTASYAGSLAVAATGRCAHRRPRCVLLGRGL